MMARNLVLEGKNVYLEEVQPKYFSSIISWRNNPENNRFLNQPFKLTMELQKRWYENTYLEDASQGLLVAVDKSNETPFATLGWTDYNADEGIAIVGRLLVGEHIYRGSLRWLEAAMIVNDYLYFKKNVQYMYAHVVVDNVASVKWHLKWGYRENVDIRYPRELIVNNMVQKEYIRTKAEYESIYNIISNKLNALNCCYNKYGGVKVSFTVMYCHFQHLLPKLSLSRQLRREKRQ